MVDHAKGYIPRDYEEVPEFSAYREFTGPRVPRSEWKERIEYLNEIKAQPVHWHKKDVEILNQKSWGYCWMYGTVACVANAYAHQGTGDPRFNAHAVAYRGKKGANRGGFGVEACRYIQDWGIPTKDSIPEYTKSTQWSEEASRDAAQHKLVDFEELGRDDFDGVVSALIGPDPCAVTLAFNWWGHLVAGVGVARKGNDYGLIIANSWGTNWSDGGESGGYGILWGRKAIPFESVAVRYVKAREEV